MQNDADGKLKSMACSSCQSETEGCQVKAAVHCSRVGEPMKIYCTTCESDQEAIKARGRDLYPGKGNDKRYYRCTGCDRSWVTRHRHTGEPMGTMAGPDVRRLRSNAHRLVDPIWQSGRMSRQALYLKIGRLTGRDYHAGTLATKAELDAVERAIGELYETGQVQR